MFDQIHNLEQKKRQTTWVSETQLVPINGKLPATSQKGPKIINSYLSPIHPYLPDPEFFFRNTKQGNV